MKVIGIGNNNYRVNDELEIVQQVYWNETFEEWTPVLWEQEMRI
jgi:hypothetical protein